LRKNPHEAVAAVGDILMGGKRKAITFVITWGTSRVVSWSTGIGSLVLAAVLALVIFSVPGGILVYHQFALSMDRDLFVATGEDYNRLRSDFVGRLDRLIAYEEKVSIMFGREKPPDLWSSDALGGRGGGLATAADSSESDPPDESIQLRNRGGVLSAGWDRKVEWLHENFREDLDFGESRRERLRATPSIAPVKGGWRTSKYGRRSSPFTGRSEFHRGLDITHRVGTPIIAPSAGKVTFVGRGPLWGVHVNIWHGFGFETFYGHMRQAAVRVGQQVDRGEVIGYLGSTGRSTGPHLHYQVNSGGIPVDPERYIFDRDWKR
jgi:murein DD-endopeptidase MepM/ murein hydrolase activator NlpD